MVLGKTIRNWMLNGATEPRNFVRLDHPLLKGLKAGTFKHSHRVGYLAKVAAKELGLDEAAAWTAGLLHDVGKSVNGNSYIEGETGDRRNSQPIDSAEHLRIILEHPLYTKNKLIEYGFSQAVIQAARRHHGTRKFRGELAPEIRSSENDRYVGPLPQTKLDALLMITDSFEAILNGQLDERKGNLTEVDIRDLVQSILAKVWRNLEEENQLVESDFVFPDLRIVQEAFTFVLLDSYLP